MDFGKRLKQLRIDKGITTREISKLFNVSKTTINNYENDKRKPDYEMIRKLADFYNVTTDYLIGTTDSPEIVVRKIDNAEFGVHKDSNYSDDDLRKAIKIIEAKIKEANK